MKRALTLVAVLLGLFAAAPAAAQAAPPDGVTGMAGDARVEIAWQPAAGATGYRVFRGTSPTTVTTPLMGSPITPPGPGVTASFTDLTAVNGTTYYYAVRATVGGVESANSRIVQATPRARTCTGPNPVVQENCFPGNADWDTGLATGMDGFATASSINKGGAVDLKLQAGTGATVDIEVFRSGYYGGAGARLFSTLTAVPVGTQPGCISTNSTGLLDCSNWTVNATLTTTSSWPSGMYLLRVTRRDTGRDTHIPLVIRDDARDTQILYGIPDTTYQAYNYWGGKSLYDDKSTGVQTVAGTARAVKVSFDRPYQAPHDEILRDWYTRADFPTVSWLEESGYDVSYAAASDLERSGAEVRDHRVYISGAHDEYWSAAMRTALEQARDAGVDLFFTGANEVYWKVRFEASAVSSVQDRVMVNYKSTQSGGPDPSGIPTGTWRDPAGANQPENALTGGQYIGQRNFEYFPLRVPAAQGRDRIWRYTGLDTQATGATATVGTALVGWEWDARVDNGREPPGVITLSSSPVNGDLLQDAGRDYAPGSATTHMVKHQRPSGSLIVATGTNHWNWGLARNALNEGEPDRRIRQATTNVLFDMGAFPETPESDIVLDDPASPPLVTLRVPSANAANVDKDAVVRAGFSRPMDPASLTTASFSLRKPDGTAVPAVVTYDEVAFTATLSPTVELDLETTYTVRIEPTVRAANGIALAGLQTWSFTTRPPDRTAPTVSITAPANGSTVIASTTVTANAADETALAGVQFKLDGDDLGAEDTAAPYSVPWNATGVSAGSHTLTAVARDTSNNSTISAPVTVTVDPTGLVVALGFEEATGTTVVDLSGKGNPGTISGATHTDAGRFGRALSYDGTNDWVTVADSATIDLTNAMTLEAWVSPVSSSSWRTVLMKEQPGGLVYGVYGSNNTNTPSVHISNPAEHDTRAGAALPANTWTHLAATFDGTTVRLYVNGNQVSTGAFPGSMVTSTGALRIGGNSIWGEYFNGKIDEVRVYRRVLSAAEIQTDMGRSVAPLDSQPPTAPTGLTAGGEVGRAQLSWTAAADNTGVVRYNVHRGTTAGFTPSAANRIAQPTTTSYTDTITAGTYYYRVTAEDGAGNVGPASAEASAAVAADTTPPTVSVTGPAAGAEVRGTIDLTATAADNAGIATVQFRVDGTDVGPPDASAPYSFAWDTRSLPNGTHTITAVARDTAGNSTTSAGVAVVLDNLPVDETGLVAAYGFEEHSGTALTDSSSQANHGDLATGARTTSGRFGEALSFGGGAGSRIPDSNSLDLATAMTVEAWVNPTTATGAWRPAVLKEQTFGLVYGLYASTGSGPPSAHLFTTGEDDVRGTATLPANTWSHLATTWDGATLRLYVNGSQVASKAVSGQLLASTGVLTIGGSSALSEFFTGRVDEVRIYNRALTAGELQTDMNTPVVPAVVDGQAPTAPTGLTATGSIGQVQLSWTAATDNIGVARYNVHRSTTPGFTPGTANRIAQPATTSYTDTSAPAGTYFYKVTAEDAAGNIGPASNEATATVTADTTAPTVSITAPAGSATVSGSVAVNASASDDVAVAGVQFKLDGANLGAEDTSAPYSFTWDTLSASAGPHTLTAVARDGAGNTRTSGDVAVTVTHPPVDTSGLVGAWGFEEGTGATAEDRSSSNNDGSISGAAWNDGGRFGKALSFDGIDDRINVPDAASLDLSNELTLEAWVKPSQLAGWRTVLLKEGGSGQVYGMYASAWGDHPSGHANPGTEQWTQGPASLPVNQWSHLALTYNGTTLRLYVDGTQVSQANITGGPIQNGTGPLRIGGNAPWGEYFKGLIDEVRIYRKVLTAAEISADMAKAVVADAPPAPGPERFGQFSPPQTWPLVPVHIATLSNGKIVVFDGFDAALNSERVWDPTTNTFSPIPSGRNLFCAAHVTLPDGRLFIAGGHIAANEGTKDTSIFNPSTGQWFFGRDMARARWYPTATTLPDGRILVVSGDNITLNAPGLDVPLKNGSETLPEIYDVAADQWTPLLAGQRRMPLYPFMFVLPDGRVVDAGPDRTTRTLDTTTGQWTTVGQSPIDGHSAVMYRPGKILKSGTWADPDYPGIQSTNRAATIDFTQPNPAWQEVAPMHHGRSYHTLTVLPDGKVFASGGMSETDGIDHSKAVFPTEIWDPDTNTWTETASHARPREYHSSALLLQDGRVLLAGGGAFAPAQNESNAEIYSPPYLFKGPRPTITSAPTTLQLGSTFNVTTPDAARIQKMSFVRMGSVTHNFDMDQRFMNLTMRQGATPGTIEVDAPTNRNVAIPGWYYLFAIDGEGVPSVGWIVKVEPNAGDSQAPTAPSGVTTTVTDDRVEVDWNASTDNVGVTEYRVHRSTTAGFTPAAGNRIATVTSGTTHTDTGLAPGTYHYKVVAVDGSNNASPASAEASAVVSGDVTPPAVSITAPNAGATVGNTIDVSASATDNRGITRVQFRLDGADLGAADTSAPYTVSWNTKTATNGLHQLTAEARDAAGNATTSAQVAVTVDNGAPPTVAVTAPAVGATVTGDIDVTANADDDRGIASVQFKVDGANLGAEDTTAPYSVSWNSRSVANGSRRLTAVASDSDGNTTTSANVDVNVSNVQTGLVAAYGFDETAGTTVNDDSGSGRNGTITGATRSTAGRFGAALTFDGVDDWVTVPDAGALDLTTAMTLEAYVRPSAISSWRTVLMKEQPGGLAYGLYANSNTNRPSAHINTGSEDDTRGAAQLALNTWTHLATTYDGATLRLFVNGVQVSSKAHSGPMVVSTGALRIGGNGVWPEWFAGLIDEVRVYGRVLTAAEIQADMNLAVKPPSP